MQGNFGECKKFNQCQALHEDCPYSTCFRIDYKKIINEAKDDYLCKYYEPDLEYMKSCIEEQEKEEKAELEKRKKKPIYKFGEPWFQDLLKMEEINDD